MNVAGFAFAHLYLSVPADGELPADHWAGALLRELDLRTDRAGFTRPLRSLLVGGEAPEALGAELPQRVRQVTGTSLDGIGEWTVEVSDPRIPGSVIGSWLAGGVTRLSLRGAAATPGSLVRLAAICEGRVALGVDLTLESGAREAGAVGARIEELVGLGAGSLAFVETEPVAGSGSGPPSAVSRSAADAIADPEWNRAAWLAAVDAIQRLGWTFLDLAFAYRPGPCPVHPRAIVRRHPVLGLGPAAVTFRHPHRRWNHADARPYLEAIHGNEDPMAGSESLTRAEGRLERCWAALRSTRGLPIPAASCASTPWFRRWQRANWVQPAVAPDGGRNRLRLSREGLLVADGLAVELALELERIQRGGVDGSPRVPEL
ncbi:hypothetical protein BH23GEM11_BH23GEM11_03380 [soil metagenome]